MNKIKSDLVDKLRSKLNEANISIHSLEKHAGLKRSSVQNIMHGRSKKPSAEILYAISKVLGCPIDDFLEKDKPFAGITPTFQKQQPEETPTYIDIDLYLKATITTARLLSEQKLGYNEQFVVNYIHELYTYTLKSGQTEIDEFFAKWLYEKLYTPAS